MIVRTLTGAAACASILAGAAANAGGTPFTEESVARGVSQFVATGDSGGGGSGRGVAFVDLDQDGDADLVALGRADGVVGVWENNGAGVFTDRSATTGIPVRVGGNGVSAADCDNDGDLDLYISCWLEPNMLLRNDGGFTFVDVAASHAMNHPGPSHGSAWGDFDSDGRLDLYLVNYNLAPFSDFTMRNCLYKNLGAGAFTDVAAANAVDDPQPSFTPIFFDLDDDGDLDLHFTTDRGYHANFFDRTFRNTAGVFTDITASSGTAADVNAMGLTSGDLDRDGDLDFYITNSNQGNVCYLNNGDSTFTESALATGTIAFEVGWGATFLDYNNDANLDLYVCNMQTGNFLFENSGSFPVAEVGAAMGVNDPGESYCVATADIDLDGDLDFVVASYLSPLRLYINHEGQNRRWARFDVVGLDENGYGVGAMIKVRTGDVWQMREVQAGSNYKSQNELTAHFGLDAATLMDQITVRWPGGSPTRTLSGYRSNETWTLYPPSALGDNNFDGVIDRYDSFGFFLCLTGSGPGRVDPGCEQCDLDGDGDVDRQDVRAFLEIISDSGPPYGP